jgi:hypothetical protein
MPAAISVPRHEGGLPSRCRCTAVDTDWTGAQIPGHDVCCARIRSPRKLVAPQDRARSARAGAGAALPTPMMPSTMTEHWQWTIRVSPRHSGLDHRWRALVEIWRPDREPNTHNATVVPFARRAADQAARGSGGCGSPITSVNTDGERLGNFEAGFWAPRNS